MEQTIDVRAMPPRSRHSAIFKTWNQMPEGGRLILVNDHDPIPLFFQFAADHAGGFRREYLEKGPAIWRVRISKGAFADPGFVPAERPKHACSTPKAVPVEFVEPRLLDTRPIFAANRTPCEEIDEASASLIPGQPLVLIVPFEPVPLYVKLGRAGFEHHTTRLEDGSWRVEFRRTEDAGPAERAPTQGGCDCQQG